jgi:hypothetical protein
METPKEEFGYQVMNGGYQSAQEAADAAAAHYLPGGDMKGFRIVIFKVVGELRVTTIVEIIRR